MTLLLIYLSIALGVSFLCSLLEAALLSIPRSTIALMVEQGSPAGRQLDKMKRDVDRPLSAILTLNTIAHTVGAAGVGAEAAAVFGHAWVGVASALLTLLILVFSEIVPKTLGAVHAKRLAGFTATTVRLMVVVCYPLVIALEWVNRLIAGRKRETARISRAELQAMVMVSKEEGALAANESRVIRNIIALREIEVRQIMTPRKVVVALERTTRVGEAFGEGNPLRVARIPIYEGNIDHMVGLVMRFELNEAYRRGQTDTTLDQLARPLHAIPESASVSRALEQFLEKDSQLFQVVDEFGGTAGVVTLEDAMETLLGVEIVDETDAVVDMQELARQVNARRQRMHPTDEPDPRDE